MKDSKQKLEMPKPLVLSPEDLDLDLPDCSGMLVREGKVDYQDMLRVSEWYLPASNAVRKRLALESVLRNNSKPFEL